MHRYVFRKALCAFFGCLIVGAIALQGGLGRTARASGETVNVWLTTPDQVSLLSSQPALTFGDIGPNSTTITVNDAQSFQQMVGFGASLTDSSAWLINQMSQSQRDQLMTNLFDPNNGIGLDFLRQPMGASDLALNEYTYDDVPSGQDANLNNFSIAHDAAYIIPLLQQALQLNPNLKIMATPWTAPAWMKSNDSLEQGSLNTSDYQVYAQYFMDFIQAYQAKGIPIYAVTPQNEPENNNRLPSMPMSASDEANFIANYLGPTFVQNGITTQILDFDHNWNMSDYPTTILNSATAALFTSGTAWHCYGGDARAMSSFHSSFPNQDIYQTECSGGIWEGSGATDNEKSATANWPNGFQNTVELGINATRNWSKVVMRWALALDSSGNPTVNNPDNNPTMNGLDACQGCRGVVSIDQNSDNTYNVTYNSDYYGLGHISKFVEPNAYRIDSNSFGSGNIEDVAFKNPDGSNVLVVYNGGGATTFQVAWNNEAFSYTLPAGAAATFTWSGTGSPTTPPGNGSAYYLVNRNSGLALDDTNTSMINGTIMQQWALTNGDTNQEWSLVPAGNGYYYIVNLQSGLALDDTNGSTSNGTPVQQWALTNGDANQEWSLDTLGNGYYYIVNFNSGLALDDTNGSTSNGTQMQLWALTSGDTNQEWSLVQV